MISPFLRNTGQAWKPLVGFSILGLGLLAIFAAVITPSPDPISMLALLIPLYLFYEGAIIVSRLMKR